MPHIVIRIPNWLGDAVMASAAIEAYAAAHPHDQIALCGIPTALSVFDAAPYIHEQIPYHRTGAHKGFLGTLRLAAQLRQRSFDTGYLLTNSFSSCLLFTLARIPRRIGYQGQWKTGMLTQALPPLVRGAHQIPRYTRILQDQPCHPQPRIVLTPAEIQVAASRLSQIANPGQPIIGIAAGAAYGSAKRWPPERFAELAQRCVQERNACVLFFGSAEEAPAIEAIQKAAGEGTVSLAGKTTLRELFAILHACHTVIANDSGLMHAAAAVDTPVVGIFGPTSAVETGPTGRAVTIVQKELDCAPCFQRTCPLEHQNCMKQIHVDDIMPYL
jgi:heptosyltransferase II